MRQFSDLEKAIVKRLAEWEAVLKQQPHNYLMVSFNALINDLCKKHNGNIKASTGQLYVKVKIETIGNDSNSNLVANNSLTRELLDTVNFIDYLLRNDLIFLVVPHGKLQDWAGTVTIGITSGTGDIHVNTIEDYNFGNKVKNFYDKDIYPTQTLLDYYRSEYKTDEEIRHNQNLNSSNQNLMEARASLKVARSSVIIAIILGLIGIIASIGEVYYAWLSSKNTESKIDSIQFKIIDKNLHRLDTLDNKLNDVLFEIKKKDTVDARILNFPKLGKDSR